MFRLLASLFLLGFLSQRGDAWHLGKCPEINVKQNFTLDSYLGTWYQQASVNTEFEGRGRCVSASYSKNSSSDVTDLVNQIIRPSNDVFKMRGTAILQDPSKNEGKLIVTLFSKFLWWTIKFSGPYWILDTDYESYAVVYNCVEILGLFHDYSSILFSRVQDMSGDEELRTKFYNQTSQVLKDHNLNPKVFLPSSNVNCSSHN